MVDPIRIEGIKGTLINADAHRFFGFFSLMLKRLCFPQDNENYTFYTRKWVNCLCVRINRLVVDRWLYYE